METPRYRPIRTWQHASLIILLVCAIPSFGHTVVFGPKTFAAEQTAVERFDLTSPCDRQANAVYTLVITNGDAAGNRRASSARVALNGSEIAGPNDFSQQAASFERTVVPAASNTLEVTIHGPKDAIVTVSLRRHIDLRSDVFAEKKYFPRKDVYRDTFTASSLDDSFAVVVRNQGSASGKVVLNGTEINNAEEAVTLLASNELLVTVDSKSPSSSYLAVAIIRHATDTAGPSISLTGLSDGQIVTVPQLVAAGTVTDASGVAALTINGNAVAIGANGSFSTTLTLVEGTNTITLDAADCEGNAAHQSLKVIYQSAPNLVVTTPANNSATNQLTVPLSGTVSSESGIASVTANGQPMTISGTSWSGSLTFAGEGAKTITVIATDQLNRTTTVNVNVIVDQTVPELTITTPSDNDLFYGRSTIISGLATDALSGIGRVTCNGTNGTVAGGTFECAVTLTVGSNTLNVEAFDAAGNRAALTRTVTYIVDTVKPTISAIFSDTANAAGWFNRPVGITFRCADDQPGGAYCSAPVLLTSDGANQSATGTATDAAGNKTSITVKANVDTTMPALVVNSTPEGTFSKSPAKITGSVSDLLSGVQSIRCNGVAATLSGTSFTCALPLSSGLSLVTISATDVAGNENRQDISLRVDASAPQITITDPATTATIAAKQLTVRGNVTDDDVVASVTVNGNAATRTGDTFQATVTLADGTNNITVAATDRAGNTSSVTLTVRSFDRPTVRITQPADFAVTSSSTITVSGTLTGSVAAVDVNGIAATISGANFNAANVPLQQGRTVITATARGTNGQLATDDLNIYRDSIPPRVSVYSPANNDVVTSSSINVGGMVDDIVIGTVNAGQVTVKVNTVTATVSNRAFLASNVTLKAGANTLTIVATDRAGNITTITHNVTYNATGARIIAVSGNGQTAAIGAALSQPVKVRVLEASGAAAPGKNVTFTIVQNDGSLAAGSNSGRALSVATNSLGEASVNWTLGHRAGAGNNRVRAVADGYAGVIELTATATAGTPAKVVVDMGNNQYGVSNETLPRPLVAVVVDAGSNRLANVPVTFSVLAGGGSINGQTNITINTDSDGRALVKPRLGPGEGYDNNSFAATVAGVAQGAVFKATGRAAGPASETVISGVVLDNTNLPIPGVSIRIDQTSRSTQSDSRGQFSFTNAPAGYVKLIVDGSTAQRPGTWPMLEFIMYTNPGQNNTVGMPIYLLPIDVTRGIQVTETTGGTLTIPELPGFSLKVAPGSALFPSGSRAGTISATLVHNDKVPMTPGFGQQPKFIVTIQPPGVHFDPPAALTMPNVDGLKPGEVTEMYSFDHDLGQFVAIGTGAVSEDGTTIVSDAGVGIIKSGWHCSGNPNATGSSGCMTVDADADLETQDLDAISMTAAGPKVSVDSAGAKPKMAVEAVVNTKVTTVGACARITAFGNPVRADLTYSGWQIIDDPADATDDPTAATWVTSAGCVNTPSCSAIIRGVKAGVVTVRTFYIESTTVRKVTKDVKVRFVNFNASLKELSVYGMPMIRQDTGTSFTDVTNPIWKNTNVTNDKPVLLAPGYAIGLQATFTLVQPLPVAMSSTGFVAEIPGVAKFKADNFTVPAGTADFTVNLQGTLNSPAKSQYLNPLTITFKAAPPTWCSYTAAIGTASFPGYVVLWKPSFSPVYRTVVQLATEGTPVAEGNTAQLLQKVWSKFSSRSTHTWDNKPLKYYPAGQVFDVCGLTEEALLTQWNGNGRCGGFAPLLAKALALNGIPAQKISVVPSQGVGAEGFLVKNWSIKKTSRQSEPAWKWYWKTAGTATFINDMVSAPDPGNTYEDLTSTSGIAGQNSTPTPSQKAFPDHAIVKANGRYYDSSYGGEYSGEAQFQTDSIAYYWRPNTTNKPANWFEARQPDGTTSVTFNPEDLYGPTPTPPPVTAPERQ
jgi:Glucodextranase, domain B/Carboxypeptidase regulatory-like domain